MTLQANPRVEDVSNFVFRIALLLDLDFDPNASARSSACSCDRVVLMFGVGDADFHHLAKGLQEYAYQRLPKITAV